jgi:hypothetical protein
MMILHDTTLHGRYRRRRRRRRRRSNRENHIGLETTGM